MKQVLLPGLLVGLVMVAISLILNALTGVLLPSLMAEYEASGIFRSWSDPLMSLIFIEPFVLGIILAWVWNKTKFYFQVCKCHHPWILFGLGYWALTIPGMIMSYSSFPISLVMTLSWSFTILLQALASAFLLSKMNK